MKRFFKILFSTALIGVMFACEAELSPITIKPDPVFDKTGLYTVNTISIYDEQETVVNISRIYGLSKELDLTIGVDETLLTEYNNLNGTNYQLMPAEYYDFPSAIKLNKTDKVVELPVVIKPKALAAKGISTANNYVLPLSLNASSVEVEDKGDAAQVLLIPNIVKPTFTVKVPEENFSLSFIRDVLLPQTVEIEATSNFTTIDANMVTYEASATAVEVYNDANDVDYKLLPSEYYKVNTGVLDPETMNYKTSITFTCGKMESDDIFLLPLVMASDVYQIQQKEPIYVLVQLNTLKMWVTGADQVVVNKSGNGKISVEMNAPISNEQPVKLTVDNSLVESYNAANNTSFIPFDPSKVNVSTEAITAGEKKVDVSYQVDLTSMPFDGTDSYLLALVLDESELFTGTKVESGVIYIQPFRTLAGDYEKEIWGEEKNNRITAPAIYLAGENGWPASQNEKAHKYCINYNNKWSGGVIHFNILDESVEGYPDRKKLGDFIDRANANYGRGHDQVIDNGSWVDMKTGVVHFDLKVVDTAYKDEGGFPIQYNFTPNF
ncbi:MULTISPECIES: DUF1735 domain-containing protein [Bacteroides]|uniref:DUF1735 domain-containing protein n=1 Tax=Bacteroides TaxID=816 RepID=UPI001CE3331A|nr:MULTISPECIES: DUF1735 domain-containing protein [Bacteroides]MBE6279731.1 DUF1735 domain-containing protein [Bacteroides sp.]MCA6026547.1 DUF1735 domain-containing protein [Bacteroides thetaiotaomicron]